MDTTFSFLKTTCQRIRALLDEPDVDAKYNDDYLVRHTIGPSMVDVISRLNNTIGSPIILKIDLTLERTLAKYALPPCVQEVIRLVSTDEKGNAVLDVAPRDRMNYRGKNWSIEGGPGCFTLEIDYPSGFNTIQIWYISNGDASPHYATNGAASVVSFTGATWTEATRTITKLNAFASYAWKSGDMVTISAATNGTLADYTIASKTSDSEIVLASSPGASASSLAGQVWIRSITLSSAPALGALDRRGGAYAGQILRILPASPARVQELIIDSHTWAPGHVWTVTTRRPFHVPATTSSLIYEIAPGGSQSLYEAIVCRAALKLGTGRKITANHAESIRREYLSALKTIGDNLTNIQTRTGQGFQKDTVDNPEASAFGFWRRTTP